MLPPSPIFASLVIIGWLLFTPSAWRRYVASIDPNLSPNFALAHLTKQHWQQPTLWRRCVWLATTTLLEVSFTQLCLAPCVLLLVPRVLPSIPSKFPLQEHIALESDQVPFCTLAH